LVRALCSLAPFQFGQGVLNNIVELKARRSTINTAPASAEVAALQELQALCAGAIAAGGLDEAQALDLTVAVHRALKGTEWNVRFYRGQATGL
jgi:hypothetical protein